MQNLIATTSEVVHYIASQAVHYNPLQEVHSSRYWQILVSSNISRGNQQPFGVRLKELSYRSICFIIHDPVQREVFAAAFRDRVVHHYLYEKLEPLFEPAFIHDSYSCRKGKGTLFGIERLEHHIRSCSDNFHRPCYALKLDIKCNAESIVR